MDAHKAEEFGSGVVSFLETGIMPDRLFAPDVFVDLTTPHWRVQGQGVEDLVRIRKDGHSSTGAVPRWRCDPTPTGFVLEFEERWEDGGQHWYCREMLRADVTDGLIRELSVYCTGDWDEARQEEHRRLVRLLRP